jgi:hypothetical protein
MTTPDWLTTAVDTTDGIVALPGVQQALQNAQSISRALGILGKLDVDFKGLYNGWQTEQLEQKVTQGIDIQVQMLNLVALYVPGVGVAAEALGIVEILMPILIMIGRAVEKSPQFQSLEKKVIADMENIHRSSHGPDSWSLPGSGMHLDGEGNFIP